MPIELLAARAGRPLISAHRGCSAFAPENTVASLDGAWRAGATVAEIDVRLTRDGHVVLMHDLTLDRTTNGSGYVKDRTLAELKQLDAGGWFGPAFAGERIPTLAEVLDWCRGRLGLLIELKNYPFREMPLLEKTIEVVEAARAQEYVVCAGFDHVLLADLHRMRPDWPLEAILGERLVDPLHAARAAGATLVSLEPQFCLESDIGKLHDGGVAVLTTVLGPAHAADLRRWGLDVFQSDDVAMAAGALGPAPRVG
jgi:glycerophosphoryl diester phosphodiesterase